MKSSNLKVGDIVVIVGNSTIYDSYRYARVSERVSASEHASEQWTAILVSTCTRYRIPCPKELEEVRFAGRETNAIVHLGLPGHAILGAVYVPTDSREFIVRQCGPINDWQLYWFRWSGHPETITRMIK